MPAGAGTGPVRPIPGRLNMRHEPRHQHQIGRPRTQNLMSKGCAPTRVSPPGPFHGRNALGPLHPYQYVFQQAEHPAKSRRAAGVLLFVKAMCPRHEGNPRALAFGTPSGPRIRSPGGDAKSREPTHRTRPDSGRCPRTRKPVSPAVIHLHGPYCQTPALHLYRTVIRSKARSIEQLYDRTVIR